MYVDIENPPDHRNAAEHQQFQQKRNKKNKNEKPHEEFAVKDDSYMSCTYLYWLFYHEHKHKWSLRDSSRSLCVIGTPQCARSKDAGSEEWAMKKWRERRPIEAERDAVYLTILYLMFCWIIHNMCPVQASRQPGSQAGRHLKQMCYAVMGDL